MLICGNTEGVHCQGKVGNPWFISFNWCLCTVVVSGTLMYSFLVIRYVYMFLVKNICSP